MSMTFAQAESGKITTWSTVGRTGKTRWAYSLDFTGWWPYVSEARYGSQRTAQAAAERDLADTISYCREGA
jgi:hypothetical protein